MPASCFFRSGRWRGACRRTTSLLLAGLALGVVPSVAAMAQSAPAGQHPTAGLYPAHITDASQRFGIPNHWIAAVLGAESAGDVRAVSPAGAMGLMQIMPGTWDELRVRHRLGGDPFDPRDNILAGTAYLREMLDRYGNVGAMLAAYNAGPGRYDEYLSSGRPLPAETRAYVAALAPLLGADPLHEGAAPSPPLPADWRDSPLFTALPERASSARSAPLLDAASADPVAARLRDGGAVSGQDNGLFVPLSGAGGRP